MTTSVHNLIQSTLVLFLLAAGLLGHSTARAQTLEDVHHVLLLVVASDAADSALRAEHAFHQELEARGLEVVVQRAPERQTGQPPAPDACISGGCLERRLGDAHAQLLVGLGAWLAREQPQIVLTLDDGQGAVNLTEQLSPGETDAHFAARMLDRATEMFRRRAGVPLRVDGTPVGASVVIDHRPLGQLPVTAHMQPGPHDITVAHVDYVTERRHVTLGEDGAEVHIVLQREQAADTVTSGGTPAAPDDLVSHHGGRSHSIVGPALLFIAAAAGVAGGVYGLTRSGCFDRNALGECLRARETPSGGIALGFGGAALALLGSVLWFSLGGIADGTQTHATLGISPRGIQLHVSY